MIGNSQAILVSDLSQNPGIDPAKELISEMKEKIRDLTERPRNSVIEIIDSVSINQGFKTATSLNGFFLPVTQNQYTIQPINLPSPRSRRITPASSLVFNYSVKFFDSRDAAFMPVNLPSDSFSADVYLSAGILNQNDKASKLNPFFCISLGKLSYNVVSNQFNFTTSKGFLNLSSTLPSRPITSSFPDFLVDPDKITADQYNQLIAGDVDQLAVGVYIDSTDLSLNNSLFIQDMGVGLYDSGYIDSIGQSILMYTTPWLSWTYNLSFDSIASLASFELSL
jgi:hypothetical protein